MFVSATTITMQPTERKTSVIAVRVTPAERRKFEKMAKERHTDISEFTRQLLHGAADAQSERA